MQKVISTAVIKRLPRYYRYLGELRKKEVVRISSKELSEKMNVTASQIRQDLNNFGGFGQQGYGYNVEYLYTEIGKILGLDQEHEVVIVGAGNIGQAIANYADFARRGFDFKAVFDVKPELIGRKIGNVKVRDMRELKEYVIKNKPDIVALALPKEYAVQVANDVVSWGVNAIWNFAPVELRLPKHVVVENVHLTESLMRLSYNIRALQDKQKENGAEQQSAAKTIEESAVTKE
ncbi:MAG: redox-sensing transcriptional repressor Rex [Lachnospiraceae bacterium]|nr:redox-sensing transcriptional repressor Rex [Lachnospiraceae bacterium]